LREKGFRRHLLISERIQKASVDFRRDSEGICGLQKGFRRHLLTAERINASIASQHRKKNLEKNNDFRF
jgi:hypothetical protein